MKTLLCTSLAALLLASCQSTDFQKKFGKDAPNAQVTITKINQPITLDGKLDEAIWQKTPVYDTSLMWFPRIDNSRCPKRAQPGPFQTAKVRFLTDSKYLYIGVENVDTDVVQKGDKDQTHLYQTGDLIEVFIKSRQSPKYHEIYAAPNNKKTTLFFDTRSYPRTDAETPYPGYNCAAHVRGTLNNNNDIDKGWDVELAIPIKMLEEHTGIRFDSKGQWTIQVARYNYTFGDSINPQFSTVPMLPFIDYHLIEYYADIKFADATK